MNGSNLAFGLFLKEKAVNQMKKVREREQRLERVLERREGFARINNSRRPIEADSLSDSRCRVSTESVNRRNRRPSIREIYSASQLAIIEKVFTQLHTYYTKP